jgi:hypothetical protein
MNRINKRLVAFLEEHENPNVMDRAAKFFVRCVGREDLRKVKELIEMDSRILYLDTGGSFSHHTQRSILLSSVKSEDIELIKLLIKTE